MHPSKIALVALLVAPAAAFAQTTVYSTDFSTGTLRTSGTTYDVGDWVIGSTKAITASSLSASGLSFSIANTTSGFAEVQSRILGSSAALVSASDSVTLAVTFTNTSNLMAGSDSSVTFGLFDSTGVNPLTGLANNLAGTDLTTGGSSGWSGYVLRFVNTGQNAIYTRPAQTDTTNEAQELLYNNRGTGAYDAPGGSDIATGAVTGLSLTASSQYTAVFTITRNLANGQDIAGSLFSGVGTGGTELASISGTIAVPVTNIFSGIAIGFRDGDTVGTQTNTLEIDSVSLQLTTVPEPSGFAAIAGLAGLGLAASRRRRAA